MKLSAALLMLRIQIVPKVTIVPYTALCEETAQELRCVPGIKQDAEGVWTAPDGTHVAWFKDPDGQILSIDDSPSMKR